MAIAKQAFHVSNGLSRRARCARSITRSAFPIHAKTRALLLSATRFELLIAEARSHRYVSALATQLPLVRTGKVKVLAITNRERALLLPDVPTVAEAGFADLAFEAFLGFFGPRGMPGGSRDRISADIRAVGADPAIGTRLASAGLIVRTNTPAEFSEIIERGRARIREFDRTMDRKPE
jgi:hypothetical protein